MPRNRVVNPLVIASAIAATLVLPAFLGINETLSAVALFAVFFAVAILHPVNGITFILLTFPFFLGEASWPCFWLLDVFIYSLLLVCAVGALMGRWKYKFPLKWPVLFLIAVSVIALPLNATESLYNLWVYSWREAVSIWAVGSYDPFLRYLRVLMNMGSGACLMIVAHSHFKQLDDNEIKKIYQAIVVMAGGVCVLGLLMFYRLVPLDAERWHYLSLSMVGAHNAAVTAFAYNEQYLVHYLSLTIPLALYFVIKTGGRWSYEALYSVALALMVFMSFQAGQRAGLVSLAIAVILAVPAYIGSSGEKRKIPRWAIGLVALVAVAGMGALFSSRYDILSRFSPQTILSDPRVVLSRASLRMMKTSPALGGGLGSFYSLYDTFKARENAGLVPINAHSQYFQIVAEEGLLGVAGWGLIFSLCAIGAVRAFKKEESRERKALMAVPVISLAVWIFLGLGNTLSYVRSTEIFFWIFAGILTAWAAPSIPNLRPGKKTLTVFALVAMIALGRQAWLIKSRPMDDGFFVGFHNRERVEEGIEGRWASQRAVMVSRVKGKTAAIRMTALLPGLDKRPQKIRVWAGGQRHEVLLPDSGWREVVIPIEKASGSNEVFWFEADYALNPKQAGISGDDRNLAVFIRNVEWR
ncbi:MAG: O-antigen ligase family protein [Nitrospinae bacterium]|nr:O-antigen ligase family protein [Nitrospinota bacterium]